RGLGSDRTRRPGRSVRTRPFAGRGQNRDSNSHTRRASAIARGGDAGGGAGFCRAANRLKRNARSYVRQTSVCRGSVSEQPVETWDQTQIQIRKHRRIIGSGTASRSKNSAGE